MTDEAGAALGRTAGVEFNGLQEVDEGRPPLLTFTDDQTGSTFLVGPGESVGDALEAQRAKFNAPAPSITTPTPATREPQASQPSPVTPADVPEAIRQGRDVPDDVLAAWMATASDDDIHAAMTSLDAAPEGGRDIQALPEEVSVGETIGDQDSGFEATAVDPRTREQADAARAIGGVTGKRVVFLDFKSGAVAGFVHPDRPNTLFVNVNRAGEGLREVMTHESWHQVQDEHPALAADVQRALEPMLPAARRDYLARYAQRFGIRKAAKLAADGPAVDREAVALLLGQAATDPGVFRAFTGEKANVFRRFLDYVLRRFKGGASRGGGKLYQQAIDALTAARERYAAEARGTSGTGVTTRQGATPAFLPASQAGKPEDVSPEHAAELWRKLGVRSPYFKRWFGDWERAAQRRFLDGKPVVTLAGSEFGKAEWPLADRVAAFFKQRGGEATHPILGPVTLNRRSVKDSLSHGLGRDKAAAFAAVPDLIEQGHILSSSPNYEGRGHDRYILGAPLRIGGEDYVGVAVVKRDAQSQRFYLHEVALRKKLQAAAFKTGARADESGEPSGAAAGAIRTLLTDIYSVNPDSVSKVVDEDGEPVVVYHGTGHTFNAFGEKGFSTGDPIAPHAYFFTKNPTISSGFAFESGGVSKTPKVIPAYLSLRNPLIVDAAGRSYKDVTIPGVEKALAESRDGLIIANVMDTPGTGGFSSELSYELELALKPIIRAAPRAQIRQLYKTVFGRLPAGHGDVMLRLPWRLIHVAIGHEFTDQSADAGEVVRDALKRWGIDARKLQIIKEGLNASNQPHNVYVAFSPTQIKSATGNRGTFDPTNPDIRFLPEEPVEVEDLSPRERMRRRMRAELESRKAEKQKSGKAQEQQGESANGQPRPQGVVTAIDPASIDFDPQRFQFKLGAGQSGGRGVVKAIGTDFNPQLAGVIHVWRDPADGQTYVVNGHHRLDRALKSGADSINVMYVDAANAKEARAAGALINIAEGHGTAIDAAKFMRDSGLSPEDLAKEGVDPTRAFVIQWLALANLTPDLFNQVVQGHMTIKRGVILGGLAPEGQRAVMNALGKRAGKVSDDVLAEMVRQARLAPTGQKSIQTLFGEDKQSVNLFVEKATLASWVKKKLARRRNLFKFVSREDRAAALEEAGAGTVNLEAATNQAQDAALVEWYFDTLAASKGPISDRLNEAARRVVAGEPVDIVRKELLRDVSSAIREIERSGKTPGDRATAPAGSPSVQAPTQEQADQADESQERGDLPAQAEAQVNTNIPPAPPAAMPPPKQPGLPGVGPPGAFDSGMTGSKSGELFPQQGKSQADRDLERFRASQTPPDENTGTMFSPVKPAGGKPRFGVREGLEEVGPVPVVEVEGKRFHRGTNKERRDRVTAWALDHLVGSYRNDDTGWVIGVGSDGLRHTIGYGPMYSTFETLPVLPELLKNAVLVESRADRDGDPNIKAIHRFYAVARIDGVLNRVKITVKQSDSGELFYDHSASRMASAKKSPVIQEEDAKAHNLGRGDTVSIDMLLAGVKADDGKPYLGRENDEDSDGGSGTGGDILGSPMPSSEQLGFSAQDGRTLADQDEQGSVDREPLPSEQSKGRKAKGGWTSDLKPLSQGKGKVHKRSADKPVNVARQLAKARAARDGRDVTEAMTIYQIIADAARRFGVGQPGKGRARILARRRPVGQFLQRCGDAAPPGRSAAA